MKKSYRGFPIYALLILAVLMAWQMFSAMLGGKTGARIEYSRMLEYIEQGVISHVALEEDTIYARAAAS
ncbi:MAG: ATP-dependent metallopeptidase FtsH/Yme1/Tma family protein, partial [Candidatus Ventricola sp.]